MLKGMFTYIKLSIKVKKVKKWEIISCPQTYTVIICLKIVFNSEDIMLKTLL